MKIRLSVLSFSLLLTAAILPALAEDYEIHLRRSQQTGDKTILQGKGTEATETTLTAGGQVIRQDKKTITAEIESQVTVLAVGTNGTAVRLEHTISKLVKIDGDQRTEVLPKGAVVTVYRKNGKKVMEMNGQPLERPVAEVFSLVTPNVGDHSSDDDVFGTKERKKVGDTWPGNVELMKREFGQELPGKLKSVKSTSTLKDARKDSRGTVLIIAMDLSAELAMPPSGGMTFEIAGVTFKGSFECPLQPDQPSSESNAGTFSFVGHGKPDPNGPEAELKISGKRQTSMSQSPVK